MPDATEPRDHASDASDGDRGSNDAWLLLVTSAIALFSTVAAATVSRLLRRLDSRFDPWIDTAATVLGVASVLLLVTTVAAFVLWIIVRFVDRD